MANIIGKIWSGLSVFIFVPLYIHWLGIASYGLVGFYTTLLGILVFADVGFTATLNREMARLSVLHDGQLKIRELLSTYELTYVAITLSLCLLIWIIAPKIAVDWLHNNSLPVNQVIVVIRLMGIAIALQLASGLYIGGLMGLQYQVHANNIQIFWSILRAGGTVLGLWLVSPTIYCFAIWQLVSNAAYLLIARSTIWHKVHLKQGIYFSSQVFKDTWRYSIGMFWLSIISILLLQADKLLVSKFLPLQMISYYTVAGTLASIPIMAVLPVTSAISPKLAGLVSKKDYINLLVLYNESSALVGTIAILLGLIIAFFSAELIFIWTGSENIASFTWRPVIYLVLGNIFAAILLIPHLLALAYGYVRLNVYIGILSLFVLIPLLFLGIPRFGLVGASIAWLGMNIFTIVPYLFVLHRRYFDGKFKRWIYDCIIHPTLVVFPCVCFGKYFLPRSNSRLLELSFIFMVFVFSLCLLVISRSNYRKIFINKIKSYTGN